MSPPTTSATSASENPPGILQFRANLTRDDDGLFVVSSPDLPGCYAQGETQEEAFDNYAAALADTLSILLERSIKRGEMEDDDRPESSPVLATVPFTLAPMMPIPSV